MTKRIIVAAAIAFAITACRAEREPTTPARTTMMSSQLSDALETVRAEVDALVARVAPTAAKRPRFDNGKRHSCNDAEGAPTGRVRSQFGYILDSNATDGSGLLDVAREFFANRELSVNADHVTDDPPAVFAEGNGFSYSAVVNSAGELVVGGTTPCFPPS